MSRIQKNKFTKVTNLLSRVFIGDNIETKEKSESQINID